MSLGSWFLSHKRDIEEALETRLPILDYLDKAEGEITAERYFPNWFRSLISKVIEEKGSERTSYLYDWGQINQSWDSGLLELTKKSSESQREIPVIFRVGKLIRKYGTEEQLHYFEKRGPVQWGWRITADPIELILAPQKKWPSCYSPGTPNDGSPIFATRDGAVLLYWLLDGKEVGRMYINPACLKGTPVVLFGGTVGEGPRCGELKLQKEFPWEITSDDFWADLNREKVLHAFRKEA